MNGLLQINEQNTITMSSREIAELCEKEHKTVVRDIRVMLIQLYGDDYVSKNIPEHYRNRHSEYIRENAGKILEAITKDGTNWNHQQKGYSWERDNRGYITVFRLDKEHSLTLIAGYNVKLRKRIIDRWQELENQQKPTALLPQNYLQALEALVESEKQKQVLALENQEMKPKADFVDHYVEVGTTKSLRETAKILNMPERKMIECLVLDKFLYRQSGNLLPYQKSQERGLFTVKTGTAEHGHNFTQTRVTSKGVEFIASRYASELML